MKFQSFASPQAYDSVFAHMRQLTLARGPHTEDEVWFMEHCPVFTQGQAGKPEHILNPKDIPVVQSDRGGQVTYHGPGQLMIYVLLNLKRLDLGPRALVTALEQSVIEVLSNYHLKAFAKPQAPGVYLEDGSKIASIGLRIRKGCSYHGISFNHKLDLSPFDCINPCGFKNLPVTRLDDHVPHVSRNELEQQFQRALIKYLTPLPQESYA